VKHPGVFLPVWWVAIWGHLGVGFVLPGVVIGKEEPFRGLLFFFVGVWVAVLGIWNDVFGGVGEKRFGDVGDG